MARRESSLGDKVSVDMTPMIDVVFQLMSFFMCTLKVVAPEGDFDIRMPLGAAAAAAPDDQQVPPVRVKLSAGAVITGVIGILIMPWKLLASADTYVFNWLVGYSGLLGPIAGIMVVDYWLIRHRELDVADLYRVDGRYAGVNWIAMAALVAGVAPNLVGFLRSLKVLGGGPDGWDAVYPYAWFTGFIVAALVYRLAMPGSRFASADRRPS